MSTPTLDDLLDLLPDNSTGAIDAADLRQIVTVLWGKSSIGGHLDHLGNLVQGPAGWSAVRESAGVYTVTHNLGTLDYAVTITPMTKSDEQGNAASITATSEESFTYQVFNSAAAAMHDVDTLFVVAVS